MGQPLDTVKVKMQTFPTLYRNAFHCFKTTLVNEGIWRGLYAGTLPSLAAQVKRIHKTGQRLVKKRWLLVFNAMFRNNVDNIIVQLGAMHAGCQLKPFKPFF